MRKAFTVHDRFRVPGRGTVMAARSVDEQCALRTGQEYDLVLVDGTRHRLVALGVEAFTRCFSDIPQIGILVGDQLDASIDVQDASIEVDHDSDHDID